MNSYMLPQGTRAVANPRSTMRRHSSADPDVHQRQTRPARCARRPVASGVSTIRARELASGHGACGDQFPARSHLAASAVGEFDGEQEQRDHQHDDRRR